MNSLPKEFILTPRMTKTYRTLKTTLRMNATRIPDGIGRQRHRSDSELV